MDSPDISPRVAALVACIEADASQRVIIHNRRISAHQHAQLPPLAAKLKQQQPPQQQTASRLPMSRFRPQQQPAFGAGMTPKHQHGGYHNNSRLSAPRVHVKHAVLEAAAAPPTAQATAEAYADADADVPSADLSHSLEHTCRVSRFAASSRNHFERDVSAQVQSGHPRRSDRLREAAVREADAAQRAGRFSQSTTAGRHIACQHASLTQQLQAEVARGMVTTRAVKRAR